MCTLIVGRDILMPGSMLIAANRDEDPMHPSDEPRHLLEHPLTAGGRDRRFSGTWFAVVHLDRDGAHDHHGEGRPCERAAEDFTFLLQSRDPHA